MSWIFSARPDRLTFFLPLLLLSVDVLEDAVQTSCNHLFCKVRQALFRTPADEKRHRTTAPVLSATDTRPLPVLCLCHQECILALCDTHGAASACPNCRAPVAAAQLYAPLIQETEEETAAREAKEAEEAAAAAAAAAVSPPVDDVEMKSNDPDASPSSSSPSPPLARKRKRIPSDEDDAYEESKSAADDDEPEGNDDPDGDEVLEDGVKEEDAEEVHGEVVFDSKLNTLVRRRNNG